MSLSFKFRPGLRGMTGALVLASCLGIAHSAAAGPYNHHRRIMPRDFNAYVDPGAAAPGPAVGSWRFNAFRGSRCDSAYPMHESYPCGSPTGGPVGGMGS